MSDVVRVVFWQMYEAGERRHDPEAYEEGDSGASPCKLPFTKSELLTIPSGKLSLNLYSVLGYKEACLPMYMSIYYHTFYSGVYWSCMLNGRCGGGRGGENRTDSLTYHNCHTIYIYTWWYPLFIISCPCQQITLCWAFLLQVWTWFGDSLGKHCSY